MAADLHALFGKIDGSTVSIDLLNLGRSQKNANTAGSKGNNRFRLALDIEDCLDRFYGGYYSDWACGGQWSRAHSFVTMLVEAFEMNNIELIVFFNGTLHDARRPALAKEVRQKTNAVMKHIRMISTPPPKIWWLPPSGIRTCIRNALREMDVQIVQTVHDHTRELIDYYREHKLDGIAGQHVDYVVAQPQRYFSSHDMRMSYKGTLETKEYLINRTLEQLGITRPQLPFVAALLQPFPGSVAVDQEAVRGIYKKLELDAIVDIETRTRAMGKLVAAAPIADSPSAVVKHLKLDDWSDVLVQAVEYYQKRERLVKNGGHKKPAQQQQAAAAAASQKDQPNVNHKDVKQTNGKVNRRNRPQKSATPALAAATAIVVTAPPASDSTDSDAKPIKEPANSVEQPGDCAVESDVQTPASDASDCQRKIESEDAEYVELFEELWLKCDADDSDGETDPEVVGDSSVAIVKAAVGNTASAQKPGNAKLSPCVISNELNFVYTLPSEVIRTVFNRHKRGIIDSRLYNLLTKKEIVLPQALEDEQYRDVPSVHLFYRPARQMIYAILFNLHHQKYIHRTQCEAAAAAALAPPETTDGKDAPDASKPQVPNRQQQLKCRNGELPSTADSRPSITINEWIWSPQNEFKRPDAVQATTLAWPVPTIQRLLFGTRVEDKQRRMRAFLSVMRSDSPLMLNQKFVPQDLLVLAVVLRYMVTHPERTILARHEIDAFLATALAPKLYMADELVLPCVYLRGVSLATLFMQGVETALLANDACGLPLRWGLCSPCLFFNGKMFNLKLKVSSFVHLRELCDDSIYVEMKVNRMRMAILEGIEHLLLPSNVGTHLASNSKPAFFNAPSAQGLAPLPANAQYFAPNAGPSLPASAHLSHIDRRRSVQQQFVRQLRPNRHHDGYQFKVGGVVVGSWSNDANGRKSFAYNGNQVSMAGAGSANMHHPGLHRPHAYHHQTMHHQAGAQTAGQHSMHGRPGYGPYNDFGNGAPYAPHHHAHQHMHAQPHHHPAHHHHHGGVAHPPAASARQRSNAGPPTGLYYNGIAARKRRGTGAFATGAAGIAHRTIGRKYGSAAAAPPATGTAEPKANKGKARKTRAKQQINGKLTSATAAKADANVVSAAKTEDASEKTPVASDSVDALPASETNSPTVAEATEASTDASTGPSGN